MTKQPPLYDYAKLYRSTDLFSTETPTSISDIQNLVLLARDTKRAIRVRASAHTLGGVTLPRKNELLVRTSTLNYYRFEEPGTLTVGAGALLWDVRDFVQLHGWQMPVYNGGWAGPTVGGYISAGGMGLRIPPADKAKLISALGARDVYLTSISEAHGGFWEHVVSITVVDGTGGIREIVSGDELFKWMFGSFGQLGIVVEAKLKLLPLNEMATMNYPLGQSGVVPSVQIDDPIVNDDPPNLQGNSILFWFSYLVAPDQEELAWNQLKFWALKHKEHLHPVGGWVGPEIDGQAVGYRYKVTFKNFNPPLLYPEQEDFVLMGLMANFTNVGHLQVDSNIFAIDTDFINIALKNNFKLYLQAENIGQTVDYEGYYGTEIYRQFKAVKEQFDPDNLINPGVFFADTSIAPVKASAARAFSHTFSKLLK